MHILENRLKRGLFSFMLGGALIFAGCASMGPKEIKDGNLAQESKDDAGKSAQGNKTSIEYINVVGAGDRVIIGATGPVKYTVFRLLGPPRLIVDMPKVDIEKVSQTIKVDNDFLKDITASSYGLEKNIGRIVIVLKEGVDHEVKAGENSILVSLKKSGSSDEGNSAKASADAPSVPEQPSNATAPAAVASVNAVTAMDNPAPQAVVPASITNNADKVSAAENVPAAQAEPDSKKDNSTEPLRQATKIVKIEAAKDGKNTVITIAADGAVGNYNSFELDSPSRIVIDIWGVDNSLGKDFVSLKNKYIKAVRIGNYPDKVRLVFDTGRRIPLHAIRKSGDYIVMTVGEGAARMASLNSTQVDAVIKTAAPAALRVASLENGVSKIARRSEGALPASDSPKVAANEENPVAKETPASPASEEKTLNVEGVDFKKVDERGRLTIRGSGKLDYTVKDTEDGQTVIFDIKGATISADLSRTLDASKLHTGVLTISSYQESSGAVKNVRVLVKLKEKIDYDVNEVNGALNVDFKTPASMTEAKGSENPVVLDEGKKEFTGKKIDLDMMDANVTDVLRLLAEVSNLNIVASDDVKGTVSLRLKNVPWDQAFDIILKSKGLDMIKKGNVVMVAPEAKIKQEKESALTSKKAQEKLEDLEVVFIPANYANVNDLIPQIKGILSERGSVTSDLRTNTLIVKDIRKGREAAVNLVKRLDTTIPQVVIEARIVEAESTFLRDLGIQWGVDFRASGKPFANIFGANTPPGQTSPGQTGNIPPGVTAAGTASPSGINPPVFSPTHGVQDFAINLPAQGAIGTLGALGFIIGNAGSNPAVLDLRLSAGEQEGHLKTISRPRITTMDNKEAKIEQGESIPFATTSAAGTATTFVDANLSLTVTPHITPDGSVLMKIKANNNSIGSFKTSTGEPSINKKESQTEVLVHDGETTVIGGIVISDKNTTDSGIPFLKDIPVLGWLFKRRSISDKQTELLIFITPTILKDKAVG